MASIDELLSNLSLRRSFVFVWLSLLLSRRRILFLNHRRFYLEGRKLVAIHGHDPILKSKYFSNALNQFIYNGRLSKMSIIHINFEESKVLTVTKDAKITVADMIGNFGGTLGVFIGFSFLGLLDTLIEWLQYLLTRVASLNTKA